MTWEHFIYFAIAAVLLWTIGAWAAWKNKSSVAYITTVLGLLVFFSFILSMWISLERPPLRTMGETRLWYSFFLPFAGLIVYSRWKYKCVYLREFIQARDPFEDTDASTTKPMVRTPRHRLHVRLRCIGSCNCHGIILVVL